MQRFGLGEMEIKMAKLLWDRKGIRSGDVVKLCKGEFNWAKSTTYTMLHRLSEKGLFQNINCIVTPVISEEEYLGRIAKQMIDDKFDGSLPEFVKCVLKGMALTDAEVAKIEEIIK